MTKVFTGDTHSLNGGIAAQTTRTVAVTRTFGWVSTPGAINFSATLNGLNQTTTAALPLDVGDGTATAGWNVSSTSTTFSTAGGSPHSALVGYHGAVSPFLRVRLRRILHHPHERGELSL